MKTFSIAIDGPAGAGKSSIAKQIATKLTCIYIDTGAMYRAVGYYCMCQGIDYNEEAQVEKVVGKIQLRLSIQNEVQQIFLNEENVSLLIRNDQVAAAASKVATYKSVREALVRMQQEMAESTSLVMDGRDIGTVVLPDATLKIFLTASVEERAKRRYKEYVEKGETPCLETLMSEIRERDFQDSHRTISPLKKAEDAIELDTTYMTIDEIVEVIIGLLNARL